MSLCSLFFLLAFLPIFLAGTCLLALAAGGGTRRLGQELANLWLVVGSLVFYAFAARAAVLVLLVVAAVDFLAGLTIGGGLGRLSRGHLVALDPTTPRRPLQRVALAFALGTDLGLLLACRYASTTLSGVLTGLGVPATTLGDMGMLGTVGVSFFVFRSMSYTLEVYRGRFPATTNPLHYLGFVAFLPHLEAGPIARWGQIGPRLEMRRTSLADASSGVRRFVVGLGKKVLIANPLATVADPLFGVPPEQLTTAQAWLAVTAYTLQIYFDFSGYTDMAIGLGRMLGFDAPENFAHPYAARSVREFWQRWHMTLTSWLRDFLFLPLAYALDRRIQLLGWRARHADLLTYTVATVVTMTLCGLWHGAAWTFGAWGAFHGLLLVVERMGWERRMARLWLPLRHTWVMLMVALGWVLFRASSWQGALGMVKRLAGLGPGSLLPAPAAPLLTDVWIALALGVVLSTPSATWLQARVQRWQASGTRWAGRLGPGVELGQVAALALLFLVTLMALAGGALRPFIYARF